MRPRGLPRAAPTAPVRRAAWTAAWTGHAQPASSRVLLGHHLLRASRGGAAVQSHRRARHALFRVSPVLHLAGELAASRVDVVAAGLAYRRDDAAVLQDARERGDARVRRTLQARLR